MGTRTLNVALAAISTCFLTPAAVAQERREIPAFRTYGEPPAAADAAAIDALITQFKDAWAREDTQAVIHLHAGDVEWINAYGRLIRGARPLGEFLETRLFPAFDASASVGEAANMKLISIRHLGDDAAVVHLYTDGMRGPSRNAGEQARRTHLHFVLAKQDGDWRIEHAAIMDVR